jgi:chitinase
MQVDLPTDPSLLGPINVVNLAFWIAETGESDMQAKLFLARPDRQEVLDAYHKAGKVIMLSLFGATDDPTAKDPVAMAAEVAKLVKDNGLDGIDVDLEHALEVGKSGGDWAVKFTNAARKELGPDYFISHAPQGPHFSPTLYTYQDIIKGAGHAIDFYNIQYYNQGETNYVTCDDMLVKSANFPGSSMTELNAAGVPWEKLVLGKTMEVADGSSGHMEMADLGKCVKQGKALGWPGNIMFWQLHDPAQSAAIYTDLQAA